MSSPSLDSASLPRCLARYRLLRKLGEGGMGVVYEAEHTRLEKRVALKVLSARMQADEELRRRFEREMRAVGRVDHPGLVAALDADEADGQLFLAMELVDGCSVFDLARSLEQRGQRLAPSAACEIVRQAAVAVQAAHEAGLVHRDLKPANLMVTAEGQVKVLDLGLARIAAPLPQDEVPIGEEQPTELLGSPANAPTIVPSVDDAITSPGQVMGTIDHMAPEQAVDTRAVDARADVYSLGSSLYRLLCGEPPYSGREYPTLMTKLTAIATQTPETIGSRCDDCPDELSRIVEQAMRRELDRRIATAGELAERLAPWSDREALKAAFADWRRFDESSSDAATQLAPTEMLDPSQQATAIAESLPGSETIVPGQASVQIVETFSEQPSCEPAASEPAAPDRPSRSPLKWGGLIAGLVIAGVGATLVLMDRSPENGHIAASPAAPKETATDAAVSGSAPVASTRAGRDEPDQTRELDQAKDASATGLLFDDRRSTIRTPVELATDGRWTIETTVVPTGTNADWTDRAGPYWNDRSGVIAELISKVILMRRGDSWKFISGGGASERSKLVLNNSVALIPGTRTDLVAINDRGTLSLYVNGVLSSVEQTPPREASTRQLKLGTDFDGESNYHAFHGVIESFRVRSGIHRPLADDTLANDAAGSGDDLLVDFDAAAIDDESEATNDSVPGRWFMPSVADTGAIPASAVSFVRDFPLEPPTQSDASLLPVSLRDPGDHVAMPIDLPPGAPFTIEVWTTVHAWPPATAPNAIILYVMDLLDLKLYEDRASIYVKNTHDNEFEIHGTPPLSLDEEHQFVVQSDGTRYRLFLDGVEAQPLDAQPHAQPFEEFREHCAVRLGISQEPGSTTTNYDGVVHACRIRSTSELPVDAPRSVQDVRLQPDGSTIALYQPTADDARHQVLIDRSGHGRHAVAIGVFDDDDVD